MSLGDRANDGSISERPSHSRDSSRRNSRLKSAFVADSEESFEPLLHQHVTTQPSKKPLESLEFTSERLSQRSHELEFVSDPINATHDSVASN